MKCRALVLCLMFASCLGIAHAASIVGTCTNAKLHYTTISAALTLTPPNGTVNVCPGTYSEQLIITKPLNLVGLTIAGQPGVTVTSPSGGVVVGASGIYALIHIDNVQGSVNLENLSIQNVVPLPPYGLPVMPPEGYMNSLQFAGVLYLNSIGTADHLNINGVYLPWISRYVDGGLQPSLGIGLAVFDAPTQVVTVRNSAITNVGYSGIYSTGTLTADRDIISLSTGAYFANGITTAHGSATRNTVTLGLSGGSPYSKSVGIVGADQAQNNVVQNAEVGIAATWASNNVLLNNITGIVGNVASLNLIYASPTYRRTDNQACLSGVSMPLCLIQTQGIDLGCMDGSLARENGILNVGIGVANVESDASFSPTNVISGVATTSTGCTP